MMYQKLIELSEKCLEIARETNDINLYRFYKSASEGFRMKALKLKLEVLD